MCILSVYQWWHVMMKVFRYFISRENTQSFLFAFTGDTAKVSVQTSLPSNGHQGVVTRREGSQEGNTMTLVDFISHNEYALI